MMQFRIVFCLALFHVIACNSAVDRTGSSRQTSAQDSLHLAEMIETREQAMIDRDIETALDQFVEDATWINSQGYFFEGKQNVREFHQMLAGRDSLDYYYEAGDPRIRILDAGNALAYYSWKMYWFRRDNVVDTTMREIGLMTLSAEKRDGAWKWVAVTNQHTPWFYEQIDPVTIDE